jgi:hypothetical protein
VEPSGRNQFDARADLLNDPCYNLGRNTGTHHLVSTHAGYSISKESIFEMVEGIVVEFFLSNKFI